MNSPLLCLRPKKENSLGALSIYIYYAYLGLGLSLSLVQELPEETKPGNSLPGLWSSFELLFPPQATCYHFQSPQIAALCILSKFLVTFSGEVGWTVLTMSLLEPEHKSNFNFIITVVHCFG